MASFVELCRDGKFKEAMAMYATGGVDIHANIEEAFQGACANGHLGVAQWLWNLYSLGPECGGPHGRRGTRVIDRMTRLRAFQTACFFRRYDVVVWLLDLEIELNKQCEKVDHGAKL